MPIDPAGTTPGLTPQEPEEVEIHLRCKNTNCDSILAVEIKTPIPSPRRLYRCSKCKQVSGINVGGAVEF